MGVRDALELAPRAAVVENGPRQRAAVSGRRVPGVFEQAAGEQQRAIAQVERRLRVVAQHGEHVAGLERGADATAHRSRAVGEHDVDLESQGAT